MPLFSKRVILLLAVAVAILALARHVLPLTLNRFEVTRLCKDHVKKNNQVIEEFGAVDLMPVSMRVSYSKSGKSGHFQFKVQGTKRKGRIAVSWECAGATASFNLIEIYELRPFAPKKLIWAKV